MPISPAVVRWGYCLCSKASRCHGDLLHGQQRLGQVPGGRVWTTRSLNLSFDTDKDRQGIQVVATILFRLQHIILHWNWRWNLVDWELLNANARQVNTTKKMGDGQTKLRASWSSSGGLDEAEWTVLSGFLVNYMTSLESVLVEWKWCNSRTP